mgnify:CR=1 FL=1
MVHMNYYNPNYYNPYQFNNGNVQYAPSYPMPQPQPQNNIQNNMPLPLNGKIVDSEDIVKVTEVPIGGYGVFPKADFSEIYVKSWMPNGTTTTLTFKPVAPAENPINVQEQTTTDTETILNKIAEIEQKIDAVLTQERIVTSVPTAAEVKPAHKKEINLNGY